MDPKEINFTIKTGSSNTENMTYNEDLLNMLGLSMVFFEEAMVDVSVYCAHFHIPEITGRAKTYDIF